MNPTITEKQQRFLALRSKGKTYDEIAASLGVARRTLFYWNKELQEEIAFEETAEMESLHQELLGTREARARRLAKRLAAIEAELDKRSLAELSTVRLFSLADSLRRQLVKETTPQRPGRANVPVSRDQNPSLNSDNSESSAQTDGALAINHHLTHLSTPSPQCNDSAIAVQPEIDTPPPSPRQKTEMNCPSTRPEATLAVTSINESKHPINQPSPQCNKSAMTMQSSARTPTAASQLPPRPPQLERTIGHKIDVTKIVGWKSNHASQSSPSREQQPTCRPPA